MNRAVIGCLAGVLLLTGCSSVNVIGKVGPANLDVYMIKHDDFMTSNRMMLVIDKDGKVIASTGGTSIGPGALGVSAAAEVAVGAGVAYGAKVLADGIKNAHMGVDGTVKGTGTFTGTSSTGDSGIVVLQ